jgi:hypothetical protein
MPAALMSILPRGFAGVVRCLRRFGCPTCLDPHEAVFLVVDGCSLSGSISLNCESLGQIGTGRADAAEFDITQRLKERNELALELQVAAGHTGGNADVALFNDVRLEIRG